MSCLPSSGILPFGATKTVAITNFHETQIRTFASHIDVMLAFGIYLSNWRVGLTELDPGRSYVRTWVQSIPAQAYLSGDNVLTLVVEDVTPAPYNQPPYNPAGETDTASCVVTVIAR